jgi:hypothetical protein
MMTLVSKNGSRRTIQFVKQIGNILYGKQPNLYRSPLFVFSLDSWRII